jgi:MFS family permease
MSFHRLQTNVPLFYVYTFLNSFILDRGIWMLFLLAKGFSLAEIGLLETLYHCMKVVFEVPTGYIADRYGKRVSLLAAEAGGIASAVVMLWGEEPAAIVAGFILGGLMGTLQSGANSALIYDTLKTLGREAGFKRFNSQLYAVMLVTMGISGTAGGILSDIDWAWVYAGKTILHSLTLLSVYFMTEPACSDAENLGHGASCFTFYRQMKISWQFMLSNLPFLSLCLYGAVLYSMSWSISFYSQVVFQTIGLTNTVIGTLNGLETWLSAGVAAAAFVLERKIKKSGSLVAAGLGFTASFMLFTMSSNPVQVIAAFYLMAVFISYLEPLLDAYLNEQVPSPIRATMLSIFSMMVSGGMMLTFSAIGFLAEAFTLSSALHYALWAWIPLCLGALVWALKKI